MDTLAVSVLNVLPGGSPNNRALYDFVNVSVSSRSLGSGLLGAPPKPGRKFQNHRALNHATLARVDLKTCGRVARLPGDKFWNSAAAQLEVLGKAVLTH